MSTSRVVTHLVSIALLLLWGSVQLYFYASSRLTHYVSSDGIFRPMVLVSAIGLIVLAIFNLATMGAEEEGCCGHDHAHDEDDPKDCGHDHSHDHGHVHGKDCGHDHGHAHVHSADCGHTHDHSHDNSHEEHGHGILNESGPLGRTIAIAILAVPVIVAAVMTPDAYSGNAVINKGLYNPNYADTSRATEMSLRKTPASAAATSSVPAVAAVKQVPAGVAVDAGGRVPGSSASPAAGIEVTTPKLPAGSTPPSPAGTATAEMAKNASPAAASPAAAAKSYGSFTLEDLKAQVPQSKEGNFILEVPELYYTAGDVEVQRVLTGQPVETKAQVMPEKVNNAEGKRLRILRLLVQCCAADARPYSVPVEFKEKAPVFKDMTWVEVKGTMSYRKEGDQTVPVVQVTSITETTAPDNAMLY